MQAQPAPSSGSRPQSSKKRKRCTCACWDRWPWESRLRLNHLHPPQPQLQGAHDASRRHRDGHGQPVPLLASARLHLRRGDSDRRTPWLRLQTPVRGLQEPTTRSVALEPPDSFYESTAARSPSADHNVSLPFRRAPRQRFTNQGHSGRHACRRAGTSALSTRK